MGLKVSKNEKPRVLVLAGAGASVEYGTPATVDFGEIIDNAVNEDEYCIQVGGRDAYFTIKSQLRDYYGSKDEANFERIYHVLHELYALRLNRDAVSRFRPVMYPFLSVNGIYEENALTAALTTMLKVVYKTISCSCESPKQSLNSLKLFLEWLEGHYLPRIYTTNYDDFIEQAGAGHYFNGFSNNSPKLFPFHPLRYLVDPDFKLFDPAAYWSAWDKPGCFHLHGSVHMGFTHPTATQTEIGDLAWFPSRNGALWHSPFFGSGIERMDGTSLMRSAIITGLDKLSRIQQFPFASYYVGFARDAMESNLIIVLGSGLGDLHLNTWLKAARRCNPPKPILYVGFWSEGQSRLGSIGWNDFSDLEKKIFSELKIDLFKYPTPKFEVFKGWILAGQQSAAVWTDGFQSFLKHQDTLTDVLGQLNALP